MGKRDCKAGGRGKKKEQKKVREKTKTGPNFSTNIFEICGPHFFAFFCYQNSKSASHTPRVRPSPCKREGQ